MGNKVALGLALALAGISAPASADVAIRLTWIEVQEMVRPRPETFRQRRVLDLVVATDGGITERGARNPGARFESRSAFVHRLGVPVARPPATTVTWRVAPGNTLRRVQATRNWEHVVEVRIGERDCTATHSYRLVSGELFEMRLIGDGTPTGMRSLTPRNARCAITTRTL